MTEYLLIVVIRPIAISQANPLTSFNLTLKDYHSAAKPSISNSIYM